MTHLWKLKIKKKKPSIISKFIPMEKQRTPAKTVYLFLLKIPVSTTHKEKKKDIIAR